MLKVGDLLRDLPIGRIACARKKWVYYDIEDSEGEDSDIEDSDIADIEIEDSDIEDSEYDFEGERRYKTGKYVEWNELRDYKRSFCSLSGCFMLSDINCARFENLRFEGD